MPKNKKVVPNDGKKLRHRSTFYHEGIRYETTGNSQKEADQKAALKLIALKHGDIGISRKMSAKRWAMEWLDTYKKPSITEKSYNNYKRHVEKVICKEIGTLRLSDVTDVHLQKILNTRAGYSFSEAKHLRDTIRGIFKKARASRLIQNDPAEFLEMPATTKGTHRTITSFEREHLLKVATGHHAGLMFKVMLFCGLRPGEVTALDWRDIDFTSHEINVRAAVESGTKIIKTPKTEAGVRQVPLPDVIYDEMRAIRGNPFSPIFTQPTTGNRHTESSRNKAWHSLKRHIDISMGAKLYRNKIVISVVAPDLVPYDLRHSYCTDLRDAGVDVTLAAKFMGHADVSVTWNTYTHTTEAAVTKAKSLINLHNGGKNGGIKKQVAE